MYSIIVHPKSKLFFEESQNRQNDLKRFFPAYNILSNFYVMTQFTHTKNYRGHIKWLHVNKTVMANGKCILQTKFGYAMRGWCTQINIIMSQIYKGKIQNFST